MKDYDKKHSFFYGFLAFSQAKFKSFQSSTMKLLMLFLVLFSGLFSNIEALTQPNPAKPKARVIAIKSTSPVIAKGKKKAKKFKKIVIKKDTMTEVDPTNASSPLYEKH